MPWSDAYGADQAWHVTVRANGNRILTNRSSGDALGSWQGQTTDGADAVQWIDNVSPDQQRRLVPTWSSYKVSSVNSGRVLGVNGGSTADGAPGGSRLGSRILPANTAQSYLLLAKE